MSFAQRLSTTGNDGWAFIASGFAIAVLILPIVLLYQGWSFHVFRRRLSTPPTPSA